MIKSDMDHSQDTYKQNKRNAYRAKLNEYTTNTPDITWVAPSMSLQVTTVTQILSSQNTSNEKDVCN